MEGVTECYITIYRVEQVESEEAKVIMMQLSWQHIYAYGSYVKTCLMHDF